MAETAGRAVTLVSDAAQPEVPLVHLYPTRDVMWMIVAADQALVEEAINTVTPEDEYFNRKVVSKWCINWANAENDLGIWAKMAKLEPDELAKLQEELGVAAPVEEDDPFSEEFE